jgi:hypothetical protein
MSRWLLLIVGMIPSLWGCHWLFPYQSAKHQDVASLPLDGRSLSDGVSTEERVDKSIDQHHLDGLASCVESQPLVNRNCLSCEKATCDDLPDWRDPWSDLGCKTVLFADDFCGGIAKWTPLPAFTGVISPSGLLSLSGSMDALYAKIVPPVSTPIAGALVEIRVNLPKDGTGAVQLWADVPSTDRPSDPAIYRTCVLLNKSGSLSLSNGVRALQLTNSPATPFSASSRALILQSWIQGTTHHCQVNEDGQKRLDLPLPFVGNFPEGSSYFIFGSFKEPNETSTVQVDWVRMFSLPPMPPPT